MRNFIFPAIPASCCQRLPGAALRATRGQRAFTSVCGTRRMSSPARGRRSNPRASSGPRFRRSPWTCPELLSAGLAESGPAFARSTRSWIAASHPNRRILSRSRRGGRAGRSAWDQSGYGQAHGRRCKGNKSPGPPSDPRAARRHSMPPLLRPRPTRARQRQARVPAPLSAGSAENQAPRTCKSSSRASTPATMRSQRSPAKANASP